MNRRHPQALRLLCQFWLVWLAVCAGIAWGATAETAKLEKLTLVSGDELLGTSVGVSQGHLRWRLPGGGVIRVPITDIRRLSVPPVPKASQGQEKTPEGAAEKKPGEEKAADEKTEEAKKAATPKEGEAANPEAAPAEEKKPEEKKPAEDKKAEEKKAEEEKAKKDEKVTPAEGVAEAAAPTEDAPPVLAEPMPLTEAWYEAARSTYAFSSKKTSEWTKRFEFGGTWVEGNSQTTEGYVGGVFERQMEKVFYQLDWNGRHTTANQEVTQSRWQVNSTTDFSKQNDSKWILFLTNKHLFDRLADLNYRGTYAGGVGYRFYNEPDKRLILRVGPGGTYEKYDPPVDSRLTFDAFTEIEAKWPILDRTQVEYKSTYTPSMEDWHIFRVTSNYGLLIDLDESKAWALKVSLRHDHNSEPNPERKPDDFTTMLSVVYSRK